jgi:hypothetical protein
MSIGEVSPWGSVGKKKLGKSDGEALTTAQTLTAYKAL